MRKTFMADGKPGGFPLYPASAMERTPERNAASGRSDGPGAEPLPIAEGGRFVLAPDDPARRVPVRSDGAGIALDRQSGVEGRGVAVRVDVGRWRSIKKKNKKKK